MGFNLVNFGFNFEKFYANALRLRFFFFFFFISESPCARTCKKYSKAINLLFFQFTQEMLVYLLYLFNYILAVKYT